MALPKIDLPLMECKQPSTNEKVKYRPFTVKEEKILLVAQEADDPGAEILAMKQIVGNCFMDLDIENIPMYDLEYFLMILRSVSIDNLINFLVTDPDTEESVELKMNLDEITLTEDPDHTNEIKLNDKIISTDTPLVSLACAHPAKFPDIISKAINIRPELPKHLKFIMSSDENFEIIDPSVLDIQDFIKSNARLI